MPTNYIGSQALSVAPMMDWTDKHCRFFHRLISPNALLYTEMVTTGAIIYGNQARYLDYNHEEHPIALQLGGSEPKDLTKSMQMAKQWGYDEVNLNCGCPSKRVQKGAFGACLMAEPHLVKSCINAMQDAVPNIPITVKHRIGIDRESSYSFVRDFIGIIAESGCNTFIVHARNAWLNGLSPKENRTIPPLQYPIVQQLKIDFPHLNIILNGGLNSMNTAILAANGLDGIMLGRIAYHQPWQLRIFHNAIFKSTLPIDWSAMQSVWQQMLVYAVKQRKNFGIPIHHILRHTLGLSHGLEGAKHWRYLLSQPHILANMNDSAILNIALPNF